MGTVHDDPRIRISLLALLLTAARAGRTAEVTMAWRWLLGAVLSAASVTVLYYGLVLLPPGEAVRRFEASKAGENDFSGERDLLRGRSGTTALLVERVRTPGWDRRANAVAYLGWIRAEEAIPALEAILQHDPESGVRIQALYALCDIDPARALSWASRLSSEPEPLGNTARNVVKNGGPEGLRIHWWNAFVDPPH